MNFKIRTYLTVTILLLLLPTTVQAARQPRPSFYARYENFSTRALFNMGYTYLYKRQMADSALVCFSIIANRKDSRQLADNELRLYVNAMNYMGNIYCTYYNRYDLADEYLDRALQTAQENHFIDRLPYIIGNKANVTFIYESINGSKNAASQFIADNKKIFWEAAKVKEWRCVTTTYYNLSLSAFASPHPDKILKLIAKETASISRLKIPKNTMMLDEAMLYSKINIAYSKKNYAECARLLTSNMPSKTDYAKYNVMPMMHVVLVQIYRKMNRDDLAKEELAKLDKMSRAPSTQPILKYSINDILYEYYQQNGDSALAAHYDYQRLKTKDELNNGNNLSTVKQGRFLRQLEQISLNYQHEQQKQRTTTIVLIIVSLALIILILLVIIIYRSYQHQKHLIDVLYSRNRQLVNSNQLLLPVDEDSTGEDSSKQKNTDLPEGIVDSIIKIMENTEVICNKGFSMTQLCYLSGYNRTYVSRAIREKWGTNFNGLLNSYRIKEACKRMSDTKAYSNLTIEAIADSLGYASRSNFSTVFKRTTGMSAAEYIKRNKEEAMRQ